MLNWYICKDNDFVWEGYDDNNNLLYKIYYVSFAVGWTWEDVLHQKGGECYDTEEETMAAVKKHYAERLKQEGVY